MTTPQTETELIKLRRNLLALVEFSRLVNSSLDLSFTLTNLLLSTLGKFLATRGFVALNENGSFRVASAKGLSDELKNEVPVLSADELPEKNELLLAFAERNRFSLIEPIQSKRCFLGYLALGEKINKIPYSEDEREFIRTILNIAGTAIENALNVQELKQLNRELDNRVNRLNTLFELSKEFGSLSEDSRIGKLLLYTLLGNLMIGVYAIIYNSGDKLKILESTLPKDALSEYFHKHEIAETKTVLRSEAILRQHPELSALRAELIIPMQLQRNTKGLIILGKRMTNEPYSEADVEFISSLGSLAIVSLENKRLFQEELKKQKLEEELEVAKDIQRNLLPKALPSIPNLEMAATSISSKQVGGDYYDVIQKDEASYYVAIADVSGKGVPAALLMANLQAFLKSITKQNLPLEEATALINDLVTENTSDGKFITYFWGIIDGSGKSFHYVNAGHNPPIHLRNGRISYLEKGGIILGVMPTFVPYISETVQLQAGDILLFFTDGVTEAKDHHDREFTDASLERVLLAYAQHSANDILNGVLSELADFTRGEPQSDDITLIVIKVH